MIPEKDLLLTADGLAVGHEKKLLCGISLGIGPGECILLCGANGSGKSTLLRTFAGVLPPLAGNLRTGSTVLIPTRIPKIPGFTLEEFIRVSLYRDGRRAGQGIRTLIGESLRLLDIENLSLRDISTLSDGEFQRGCIAAALVRILLSTDSGAASSGNQIGIKDSGTDSSQKRPGTKDSGADSLKKQSGTKDSGAGASGKFPGIGDIGPGVLYEEANTGKGLILLDEPTAFLDVEGRIHVLRVLRDVALRTGASILFSSHDLADALTVATRILGITPDGRILDVRPEDSATLFSSCFPGYDRDWRSSR